MLPFAHMAALEYHLSCATPSVVTDGRPAARQRSVASMAWLTESEGSMSALPAGRFAVRKRMPLCVQSGKEESSGIVLRARGRTVNS